MKRLSNYVKVCLLFAIVSFIGAVASFNLQLVGPCALLCAATFMFLWVPAMAPNHEKYNN